MGKAMIFGGARMTVPVNSIPLSDFPEGQIVRINEGGTPVPFHLAKHDYESGLNGAGRVLFVRKDCYGTIVWNNTGSTANVVNTFNACTYDTWLNNDYKSLLDSGVQEKIGTTKFYYGVGGVGVKTVTELERSVFALSLTELGLTHTYATVEGSALPIADTLKIAYKDGSAVSQWTRSPSHGSNVAALYVNASGAATVQAVYSTAQGSRPCFTLPSETLVDPEPNADGSVNLIY